MDEKRIDGKGAKSLPKSFGFMLISNSGNSEKAKVKLLAKMAAKKSKS